MSSDKYDAVSAAEWQRLVEVARKEGFEAGRLSVLSAVRRMTPKQLDALRMLNDAFESHDGAPVMQAIITQADYRLLYEALAGGTTGDRIAQELLTPSAMTFTPDWISVTERLPMHMEQVIVQGGIAYWRDPSPEWPDGKFFTITAFDWPGKPIQWDVTHWMPMPALPDSRATQK